MTSIHHKFLPKLRGFTLIEVLVTLLVLSIGLLGLAALQASSIKFNQSAYMRTQATILAYDILDRMRANRVAANAGSYATSSANSASDYTTSCNGTGANCTAPQIASHDLREWKTTIESTLPGSTAQISQTPASGTGVIHNVTIRWIDDRSADASGGTDDRMVQVTVDGEL